MNHDKGLCRHDDNPQYAQDRDCLVLMFCFELITLIKLNIFHFIFYLFLCHDHGSYVAVLVMLVVTVAVVLTMMVTVLLTVMV